MGKAKKRNGGLTTAEGTGAAGKTYRLKDPDQKTRISTSQNQLKTNNTSQKRAKRQAEAEGVKNKAQLRPRVGAKPGRAGRRNKPQRNNKQKTASRTWSMGKQVKRGTERIGDPGAEGEKASGGREVEVRSEK